MLLSQTKDEVTDAAVAKLRTALGGSISVESVLVADKSAIANAIRKVGGEKPSECLRALLSKLFLANTKIHQANCQATT